MSSPAKSLRHPVDFRYYRHQVRKRWWLVILVVLASLSIGAFRVLTMPTFYVSSARLLIREQAVGSKAAPLNDWLDTEGGGGFMETYAKVLRSRFLAAQIIEKFGFETHPEFAAAVDPLQNNVEKLKHRAAKQLAGFLTFLQEALLGESTTDAENAMLSEWLGKLKRWVQRLAGESHKPDERVARQPEGHMRDQVVAGAESSSHTIDRFLGRLQIQPEYGSDVVRVGFRSSDARLAADVSNALVHLYIDFTRELRFSQVQDAVTWLKGRAAELQQTVAASELQLERYQEEHNIYAIEDRIAGATRQLGVLKALVAELRTQQLELETLHHQIEQMAEVSRILAILPALKVENHRLPTLNADYDKVQAELLKLRQRYGPYHPQVNQVRTKLQAQQQYIDDEIERILERFLSEIELIKTREAFTSEQVDNLKTELQELHKKTIRYRILERDVKRNRNLSGGILAQLKEASITPSLPGGDTARVIDLAPVPTAPLNNQPGKTLFTSGVLGCVFGFAFAAGLGFLSNRFETPQEAEEHLGLTVVGLIGKHKALRKRKRDIDKDLFVLQAPRSQTSEAFKTLRTHVLFSDAGSPRKVFMITSSTPNEGKTAISANLAVTIAQMELRVLLIEADLRNPSLEKMFKIEGQPGVSQLLHEGDFDTGAKLFEGHLSVVPAGHPLPPNPAELLGSRRMQRYLEYVREQYDLIIIDTPPILAVSDALSLSPLVDGTLLVLRANATSFDQVRHTIRLMASIKRDLFNPDDDDAAIIDRKSRVEMGLVMNCLDASVGQSYGYYGNYRDYYHD